MRLHSVRTSLARTPGLREADRVFGYLSRYTRFVLFSKWFLGVIAIIGITALIAWPLLTRDTSGVRVSFVMTDGKNGAPGITPVMNKPRYEGTDERGRKYTITADQAEQKPDKKIGLKNVAADMFTEQGTWLSLTAAGGEFNDITKILTLTGAVTLYHEEGYQFVTEQAEIDTNTSEARGDLPISGQGPMGKLLATGFEIKDNGNRIFFGRKGRVTMTLNRAGS